jgi:hypothetical protein
VAADLTGLEGLLADAQTPLAHAHVIADVTGLQTALDNAASGGPHTHPISEIVDLQTALDGKQDVGGPAGASQLDVVLVNPAFIWTNMPAAETELVNNASVRFKIDLTGYTEYRWMVNVNVVGAATADLRVQYAADDVTYADLSSEIAINTLGRKVTAWEALPVGARADVFLRVMGKQGNGTADPNLSQLRLQVR